MERCEVDENKRHLCAKEEAEGVSAGSHCDDCECDLQEHCRQNQRCSCAMCGGHEFLNRFEPNRNNIHCPECKCRWCVCDFRRERHEYETPTILCSNGCYYCEVSPLTKAYRYEKEYDDNCLQVEKIMLKECIESQKDRKLQLMNITSVPSELAIVIQEYEVEIDHTIICKHVNIKWMTLEDYKKWH